MDIKIARNLTLNDSLFRVTLEEIQIIEIYGIELRSDDSIHIKNKNHFWGYEFKPEGIKAQIKGVHIYCDFNEAQKAQNQLRVDEVNKLQSLAQEAQQKFVKQLNFNSFTELSNPFKDK